MRTHLIALAATLGIAGLVAAPMAAAAPPSGGGSSGGGGVSAGGGGGGGSQGGGGGGARGGGGYGGGHFGGGHYGGGHFGTGGYRGGGYGGRGGYAAHASFMAHGGFVSHGTSGYRIVGSESAGIAHVNASPRGGHAGRISLALGPRMGSAATAARLDRAGHQERVSSVGKPHPGHHPWHHPGQPKRLHVRVVNEAYAYRRYDRIAPDFCDSRVVLYKGQLLRTGCLWPTKMKVSSAR